MSYRTKHIADAYELNDKEATKLIKRVDRQRHNYYKYITGKNRGDRNGKQLMIDVERFATSFMVANPFSISLQVFSKTSFTFTRRFLFLLF